MTTRTTTKTTAPPNAGPTVGIAVAPNTEQAGRPLRAFSRSLPMALLRCREAVMTRFRPMLREHGISEQQWRILRALSSDGPMRAGDLAADTLLSTPSVSRLLKSLAAKRLIRRGTSAEDLRAARITITDKGQRLVDEIAPRSEAIYAEISAAVGAHALDQLYRSLAATTLRLGVCAVEVEPLTGSDGQEY